MTNMVSHFFANSLGKFTSVNVLLPDRPQKDRPIPTLYLLHGHSDDESIWMRRTALELYAGNYYMAVVMPRGDRSFYNDMPSSENYFTFITKELPKVMESYFPLSSERKDRFIAGLSMGGWGSLKAILNCPETYAAGASLSGVTDISWLKGANLKTYEADFGADYIPEGVNDLYKLAEKLAELPDEERPKIFQYCGVDDFLYKDNIKFRDHLANLKLEAHYEEGPGGHCWTNWNERIVNVLKWLPLSENIVKTGSVGV